MLAEIKKQFYSDTLRELEGISGKLTAKELPENEYPLIAEKIFTISHQISGTGPMLGFHSSSVLSRKLERTYYHIRSGEREITPQLLWQTKRALEAIIKAINEENKQQEFQ
jgi:chemotaxis protein histidine kinase CheA